MPIRVQRKREKGWKMPPNTVYVGRGSIWGNPFVIGEPSGVFPEGAGRHGKAEVMIPALTREQAIEFYRMVLSGFCDPEMYPHGHDWARRFRERFNSDPGSEARYTLRGKNLACWCAPGESCHADVLLELANSD